jgi:hypothetical protein
MESNTVRGKHGACAAELDGARSSRLGLRGALVLIALGCGSATAPTALPETGGTSAGGTGAGGDGGDGELPPGSAPACTDALATFVSVYLPGGPVRDRVGAAPHRARVLARGLGPPDELAEASAEAGWLRLVELGSGAADAGAASGEPWLLVGPRELGELPVDEGSEVALTVESTGNVMLRHWRVVLEQGDRVLVFHQDSNVDPFQLGTFWGFTLARGEAVCTTPVPTRDDRCADAYRHALDISVPGGQSATLAPWEAQTVGSYRVLHGTSDSVEIVRPATPADQCAADLVDGPTQVTAVLLP